MDYSYSKSIRLANPWRVGIDWAFYGLVSPVSGDDLARLKAEARA